MLVREMRFGVKSVALTIELYDFIIFVAKNEQKEMLRSFNQLLLA